jgi:hypothetical protein
MIPAPALAIVFVVVEMLRFSGHQVLGGVVFVFVGAVLSPILLRSFGMLSDLPQIPAVPLLAKLVSPSRRTGKARTTGPRRAPGSGMGSKRPVDGPPRTSRPSTARTKAKGSDPSTVVQGPWDAKPVDQRELDRLLDKIAAQGIDSLSADERKMLDEASRRLRERRDS